jgi:UDP-galactopyranose mutase
MRLLVIGGGFSGAVVARQLADALPCAIEVWDERDHIGGNCHTERDAETGVMVHRYGPHIFNTDDDRVWDYVRRFGGSTLVLGPPAGKDDATLTLLPNILEAPGS